MVFASFCRTVLHSWNCVSSASSSGGVSIQCHYCDIVSQILDDDKILECHCFLVQIRQHSTQVHNLSKGEDTHKQSHQYQYNTHLTLSTHWVLVAPASVYRNIPTLSPISSWDVAGVRCKDSCVTPSTVERAAVVGQVVEGLLPVPNTVRATESALARSSERVVLCTPVRE